MKRDPSDIATEQNRLERGRTRRRKSQRARVDLLILGLMVLRKGVK